MKLLVNIECPLGLKTPDFYIPYIVDKLHVSKENVWLCESSGISWYWILSGVDKHIYLEECNNLSMEFLRLTEKGLVQYFYIGKAEVDFQNTQLSSEMLETY